ncbi:hypothetical protein F511_35321 [Dorcoceras hygrometricum]|uniref:Uncharacterized protein n=1 Tax=Dorcoceras hygrometricum TaxID=472368 RepID=A0A2Z7BZN4_9LAMI|nr:hypothetical protein F511_35321 [Dorcoceras hygrometricum]
MVGARHELPARYSIKRPMNVIDLCFLIVLIVSRPLFLFFRCLAGRRDPDPPRLPIKDWSRREDIQTGTTMGRLRWTGRRYLAGTVRGRPSWFSSLLSVLQGTPSWFIGLEQEQHEDQAQAKQDIPPIKISPVTIVESGLACSAVMTYALLVTSCFDRAVLIYVSLRTTLVAAALTSSTLTRMVPLTIGANWPIFCGGNYTDRLGLKDAGIDQLNFHSVQLDYLELLQMGNTDPNKTKAGKEVRGQASVRRAIKAAAKFTTSKKIDMFMLQLLRAAQSYLNSTNSTSLIELEMEETHGQRNRFLLLRNLRQKVPGSLICSKSQELTQLKHKSEPAFSKTYGQNTTQVPFSYAETPAANSSRLKTAICWSRENSQNDDASTKSNDATSQRFRTSAPADQQQLSQRNYYQQQGIRHAYVTTSIDSSRDKDSTHLLISFTNASAESNSQRSKMLTNTRHYFVQSHATRDVCQQQLQIRNLKPAALIASR